MARRVYLAQEAHVNVDLEAVARGLDSTCGEVRFTSGAPVAIPDEKISSPQTYDRLPPDFVALGKE
jgi:hypothetical protein